MIRVEGDFLSLEQALAKVKECDVQIEAHERAIHEHESGIENCRRIIDEVRGRRTPTALALARYLIPGVEAPHEAAQEAPLEQ